MEGAAGDLVGLVGFEPIYPPVMSRTHVPYMLKANRWMAPPHPVAIISLPLSVGDQVRRH